MHCIGIAGMLWCTVEFLVNVMGFVCMFWRNLLLGRTLERVVNDPILFVAKAMVYVDFYGSIMGRLHEKRLLVVRNTYIESIEFSVSKLCGVGGPWIPISQSGPPRWAALFGNPSVIGFGVFPNRLVLFSSSQFILEQQAPLLLSYFTRVRHDKGCSCPQPFSTTPAWWMYSESDNSHGWWLQVGRIQISVSGNMGVLVFLHPSLSCSA